MYYICKKVHNTYVQNNVNKVVVSYNGIGKHISEINSILIIIICVVRIWSDRCYCRYLRWFPYLMCFVVI